MKASSFRAACQRTFPGAWEAVYAACFEVFSRAAA